MGAGLPNEANQGEVPADGVLSLMIRSGRKVIKLSLQDLGSAAAAIGKPGVRRVANALGFSWAFWQLGHLDAIAHAIYYGTEVNIILSNNGACPDPVHAPMQAYGNG